MLDLRGNTGHQRPKACWSLGTSGKEDAKGDAKSRAAPEAKERPGTIGER